MAQHSGFFNALQNGSGYDRTYNADDYCDNLAVVISNGVLRSANDDLKVSSAGLVASVAAGRAWINGHYFHNDTPFTFAEATPPLGGNRYDRIVLRLDKSISVRSISLVYLTGTAAQTPTKPELTRDENVFDICLADIYIAANGTTMTVSDTRADASVCGWVYSTSGDQSFITSLDNSFNTWFDSARDTLSSVTLFKRYTWQQTLAASTSQITFDIPQFDADTCFIEVYVNGIFDTRYSQANNIITFAGTLIAGTIVRVNCYKSIDGEGIMTVADEITELQQEYATLSGVSRFVYKCTGLNDNISLSQIAQAFIEGSYTASDVTTAAKDFLDTIGGNTYLAGLEADAQMTVEVVGKLGVTTPFAGDGSVASRYKWFSLGRATVTDKKIVFDFAKCDKIKFSPAADTNNIVFFGTDVYVRNANVDIQTSAASCAITMVTGGNKFGRIQFADCRLKVRTTGTAVIAESGEFTNCVLHTKSATSHSYIFCCEQTECFARMNGGSASCYVGDGSKNAAIFYISTAATNAVIMAENVNAPTISQSGYSQKNLAIANAGMIQIYGVCSTQTSTGVSANLNIFGQIWKSKY